MKKILWILGVLSAMTFSISLTMTPPKKRTAKELVALLVAHKFNGSGHGDVLQDIYDMGNDPELLELQTALKEEGHLVALYLTLRKACEVSAKKTSDWVTIGRDIILMNLLVRTDEQCCTYYAMYQNPGLVDQFSSLKEADKAGAFRLKSFIWFGPQLLADGDGKFNGQFGFQACLADAKKWLIAPGGKEASQDAKLSESNIAARVAKLSSVLVGRYSYQEKSSVRSNRVFFVSPPDAQLKASEEQATLKARRIRAILEEMEVLTKVQSWADYFTGIRADSLQAMFVNAACTCGKLVLSAAAGLGSAVKPLIVRPLKPNEKTPDDGGEGIALTSTTVQAAIGPDGSESVVSDGAKDPKKDLKHSVVASSSVSAKQSMAAAVSGGEEDDGGFVSVSASDGAPSADIASLTAAMSNATLSDGKSPAMAAAASSGTSPASASAVAQPTASTGVAKAENEV